MKFESVIVQPTRLLDSKVVLVIPEELPNWEIRPKRLPPAVSTCDICVHIAVPPSIIIIKIYPYFIWNCARKYGIRRKRSNIRIWILVT